MEYLTIQEVSDRWELSKRRIQILCKEKRIPGARMLGNMWVIPDNASRPIDERVKTPLIKKHNDVSEARRELKRLLRDLYSRHSKAESSNSNRKSYVLSLIAAGLFAIYTEEEMTKKVLTMLYEDIASQKCSISFDNDDVNRVKDFFEKNKEDNDLENILSWAYQYSNGILKNNDFSSTQFFTEKYMVEYLVSKVPELQTARKILDPCVGGGNFLVECLESLCNSECLIDKKKVLLNVKKLFGYDIDGAIANIATVNIKLRALSIMKKNNLRFEYPDWKKITPNIYKSETAEAIKGSLDEGETIVVRVLDGKKVSIRQVLSGADVVLTNPPFASVKGMNNAVKVFLKDQYPLSNCDTCVAFILAVKRMMKKEGVCGIVTQNAWMHLKSFAEARKLITETYALRSIAILGSGAFQDLRGEKSNVALITFENFHKENNVISILDVSSIGYEDKKRALQSKQEYMKKQQDEIDGPNGFDFSEDDILRKITENRMQYKDVAVPMQGTSTGNAKELVGFFWEHFNDDDWISVSNGGGYCRWEGLNDSVVKWGKDGEFIKQQKGSALRNARYFPETQLVFSDTGTAGLNVRVLLDNQIFIASGPGIRIQKGNEYSHLALLNSRLAAYCVRLMSPKLTIAAGYIGRIPTIEKINSSVVLEKHARTCIDLKIKTLSTRPSNLEYDDAYLQKLPSDLLQAAWSLFNEDITNELMKLEIEAKIDSKILEEFGFDERVRKTLDASVGECAYDISDFETVDNSRLDRYLDSITDASCNLKRTKTAKNSLGSDGYIEYAAKDLGINPERIVKEIQSDPYDFLKVLKKYRELLLHNIVLHSMGYSTNNGVSAGPKNASLIAKEIAGIFTDDYDYERWITERFNAVHKEVFKGSPYLKYENKEIHINDNCFTG